MLRRARALATSWRAPLAWLLSRVPLRLLFEVLYSTAADPWDYRASGLEQERYRKILALLESWREAASGQFAPGTIPGTTPCPSSRDGSLEAAPLRILELGCSVGVFTVRLGECLSGHLTGVDISGLALGRARQRWLASRPPGDATFVQANIFTDELPPGPFDVVVVSDVLGYADDLAGVADVRDKVVRSLRSGACVVLANTCLREHDGHGWEPFASGYPRLGAKAMLDVFLHDLDVQASCVEERYRVDLLGVRAL